MAEIKTLGPVGLNPLGEYNSETEYEKLDVVLYQGSSYVALQTVQGQVPTNTEYWQKLVSGGVGVDDIVDNLDSNDGEKPLSAKQGNNLNKSKVEVFDTVALMKAANLKVGMTVQTLGYYEVNDGGSGEYIIVNDNTLIADDGSILLLSNGLKAKLIIHNDTVNIKQFGAKGNGIDNDSVPIQNALKFKENNYIKIVFPDNKTFIAKNKIFIYSNTDIDLNGSTIKDADDAVVSTDTNNLQFLNNYDSMYSTGYGALKNFSIKNGILDGNLGGVMFCLFHGENLKFKDIYFKNAFVGTHVFDMGGCKDILIKDCQFIGNLLSVDANKFREVIQPDYANYASVPYWGNNENYGFDLLPCENITIDGCVFKKNENDTYYLNAVGTHAINTTAHKNIVIKNCEIYDFEYAAIRLPRVQGLIIDNNIFYNLSTTRSIDSPFILLENMSASTYGKVPKRDITISNNKFQNVGDRTDAIFIKISGYSDEVDKNIHIINNEYKGLSVEDDPFATSSNPGQDFSQISNCEDIYLMNNTIEQAKSIIYRGSNATLKNLNISNNIFIQCSRPIRGADSDTLDADNIDGFIYSNNIWKNSHGEMNTSSFCVFGEYDENSVVETNGYCVPSSFSKDMFRIAANEHDTVIPYYIKNLTISGYISFLPTVSGDYNVRIRVYDSYKEAFIIDESILYTVTANKAIKMDLPKINLEEYSLRHNKFGMYAGHYFVVVTTTLPSGTQILKSNPSNNRASKIIIEGH